MKFLNPWMLALAIPLIILTVYIIMSSKKKRDEPYSKARKARQIVVLLSRIIAIALVCIALAQPVSELSIFSSADTVLTVLIDESASMQVFDQAAQEEFINELERFTPVQSRTIASQYQSPLAENIVRELTANQDVLVVTDGWSTQGASIMATSGFAAGLNTSLSFLELPVTNNDAAVSIKAPSRAIADNPTTVYLQISSTTNEPIPTTLTLDGETILEEELQPPGTTINLELEEGQHVLQAQIESEDFREENNQFYATISVREQPKIIVQTSRQRPVDLLIDSLYDATYVQSIPDELSQYMAAVIIDEPARNLQEPAITQYLLDGNGAVFIGGQNSFDQGGYSNHPIENILPVTIGRGEREQGNANIVLAIDMSSSTQSGNTQRIEKSLAVSILQELNPTNKVGVLAFTYPQLNSPNGCTGACVIAPVQRLASVRSQLIEQVTRVDLQGNTALWTGLQGSLQLLENVPGSKNVIMITDGKTMENRERLLSIAERLRQLGGKLYVVQVGDDTSAQSLLNELASVGNGALFRASQTNKLSVLFGEPADPNEPDAFDLTVIDEYHFITQGTNPSGAIFSSNQVAPKPSSQQIITTSAGDPIFTIWYYGIGRVASINGFEGNTLGPLLQEGNSDLITRTINWAIGDPDRKSDLQIVVPDGRVNQSTPINVTSRQAPQAENISFEQVSARAYVASLPPQNPGVYTALGEQYAINYPEELERVGQRSDLAQIAGETNGEIFTTEQAREAAQYIQTLRQQKQTELQDLDWMFLLAAAIIILIEIATRQAIRRKMK